MRDHKSAAKEKNYPASFKTLQPLKSTAKNAALQDAFNKAHQDYLKTLADAMTLNWENEIAQYMKSLGPKGSIVAALTAELKGITSAMAGKHLNTCKYLY